MSTTKRSNCKDEYFAWLYSLVNDGNKYKDYWRLLNRLHKKEFVWFVLNDDNRAADGLGLREEFAEDYNIKTKDCLYILDGPCSVLEMLIALSFRLAKDVYDEENGMDIFWEIMDNLGFVSEEFQDGYFGPEQIIKTDEIVSKMITRSYCKDGSEGGLFPLLYPKRDQRRVEIWYQSQSYFLEKQKSFKN